MSSRWAAEIAEALEAKRRAAAEAWRQRETNAEVEVTPSGHPQRTCIPTAHAAVSLLWGSNRPSLNT